LNTSFYLDPQVHLARSNHTHRFFAVAKKHHDLLRRQNRTNS
jgi:hypothetical protein